MNLKDSFIRNVIDIVGNENVKIDEPMKNHTSFKVGGPADALVYPSNYEMVKSLISICKENRVDYFILGNGSNLIVRDGGIRGVVIKLGHLNKVVVDGDLVSAQCGAKLNEVADYALKNSLTGLEFASGIPGSIGGATAMNAGAYDGEMSKVIESATVIDNEGNIRELSKEELEFGYRISAILKYGYIVLETRTRLSYGDKALIKERMDDLAGRRRNKQPLEYASAGSTFKRPEGYFAGKLIQDSGLKGNSVGDAEVSEKHSGFIINKGNATAKDVLDLIEVVKARVYEKFKVELHTEVRIIGEDSLT
ncbi:MAG TPA: UDP-N-acetylmuramate dehydrogenase [Clostridium sp.]|uniref:UDP-N-acetylmuramate dehydrogenase n=1 Tax=unclassified Clostridium TaxID=2614128 RepID=UPI000EDF5377|nr:UDP-N-acetylmuramate dehydrogenase [Clostridium sp.]